MNSKSPQRVNGLNGVVGIALLMLLVALNVGCDEQSVSNGSSKAHYTVTVTESNFQKVVVESDVPVLVDFWAPWCPPCVALSPVVEKLAKEMDGKIVVAKINVDDAPKLGQAYQVRAIPALFFFKNGDVVKLGEGRSLSELKAEANMVLEMKP